MSKAGAELAGLHIERIDAAAVDADVMEVRSRQLQELLPRIPDAFYAELGHPRLDSASESSGIYSPDAVTDMVRKSGPFQKTGLECVVAVDERAAPDALDALKAVFVIAKPELCDTGTGNHTTTKLEELWIEEEYRGHGVGGMLFKAGLRDLHPEDDATLHVAQPNQRARAIYESYGFRQDSEPKRLGRYDVTHVHMCVRGVELRKRLGLDG